MRWSRISAAAAVAAASLAALLPAAAPAVPAAATDPIVRSHDLLGRAVAPDGSRIVGAELLSDNRHISLTVHSAAMNANFPLLVQRPADASRPRPVLYLLNGAGGGEDSATWTKQTDVLLWLSDKNVNVVMPVGGSWSYYTDWRAKDPVLGLNKWRTFFTEEIPVLVDAALGTNKTNAIAGLSTSGTSVLQLPIAKPHLYQAVAAYSGCAQISDPVGHTFVDLAVQVWGGGNTLNMYGPQHDPMWAQNDPYVNAEKLRPVKHLYISSGNGVPGKWDALGGPHTLPGVGGWLNQVAVGGVIEGGVNWCSHNLQARLQQLNIPATYDFIPSGTHSWGYWEDAFKKSWPVLAAGLRLPA